MDLDTGVVGLLLARMLRIPFVYQCLDPYYTALPATWPRFLSGLARWLEDRVITAADLFVITDERRLAQHPGARPSNMVELVNAPTDASPSSNPRTRGDGMVVGYVGSLVPHRNLDVLIRAVGSLSAEGVRLVIGGYGPLASAISNLASAFANVDYRGWVSEQEMPGLQATFDLFYQVEDPRHPAYRWVSPNKLFDSMAYRRPILVAEGTLAAETVLQVGHGVAVPYGDEAATRNAIRLLQDDCATRLMMGEAGARAYAQRWSPEKQREGFLRAYAEALAEVERRRENSGSTLRPPATGDSTSASRATSTPSTGPSRDARR
jgi:glycosyltransferase involved in cell wall biosynthesis